MGKMTLYHGGYAIVKRPIIVKKENTKDFGDGFYWLDFIIACRHGTPHGYDIVIGAMANDQIYNYISDYIDGVITRDQFWSLARFKYPTHQINFCTDAALKCLEFVSAGEVRK